MDPGRRDFLNLTVCTVGAVCACGLGRSFHAAAGPAAQDTVDVNLRSIPPGQGLAVLWRNSPVFIRHRTPEEIREAVAGDTANLIAPQPDHERVKPGTPEWLVVVGVCTHLGCIPMGHTPAEERGAYGGWLCPCHGAEFDVSGRVRTGPADANLAIPPYIFLNSDTIRIGVSEHGA